MFETELNAANVMSRISIFLSKVLMTLRSQWSSWICEINKAIVIGSGVHPYKEEFKSQYGHIELEYFDDKCSLAASIGMLSMDKFGNEFDLKNADPIYIRNKVAQTTKERLSQK